MANNSFEALQEGEVVVLYGDGLQNISPENGEKLAVFLGAIGIQYDLVPESEVHRQQQDMRITYPNLVDLAAASEEYTQKVATKTWNLLTGYGRYLSAVTGSRNNVYMSELDKRAFNSMAPWEIDLVFDETSISRNGLHRAVRDNRFEKLPTGFGERSFRFVEHLVEHTTTPPKTK